MVEQILVFDRYLSTPIDGGISTGKEVDLFIEVALPNTYFRNRPEAEEDSNTLQVIPYVITKHTETGKILTYQRTPKGGEERLHGKYSIGIGGHINPIDKELSPEGTFIEGMDRELEEELDWGRFAPVYNDEEIIAVINDTSDSVGSVHLGVVVLSSLDIVSPGYPIPKEDSLSDMHWVTLEEAEKLPAKEHWTELCLSNPEIRRLINEMS